MYKEIWEEYFMKLLILFICDRSIYGLLGKRGREKGWRILYIFFLIKYFVIMVFKYRKVERIV